MVVGVATALGDELTGDVVDDSQRVAALGVDGDAIADHVASARVAEHDRESNATAMSNDLSGDDDACSELLRRSLDGGEIERHRPVARHCIERRRHRRRRDAAQLSNAVEIRGEHGGE